MSEHSETIGRATYSPEDNKLRLYPDSRLPKELYERVRGEGFIWAPKQELFVAPMWTPGREDLLTELCGELEDEDTSLCERSEQRAERFEGYSESRTRDAESAHKAVSAICDGIPLGQPILVGHHSERHARRDAKRIENGMRKAVKMWETAKYWEQRAAGAIRTAKYKERPDVRARRIKGIEADKRKREREKAESERGIRFWEGKFVIKNTETGEKTPLTICEENRERIYKFLDYEPELYRLGCARKEGSIHNWDRWHVADVLAPDGERYKECPAWTVEQCKDRAMHVYTAEIAYFNRWISHYENRLTYERAMLAEEGGTAADKFKMEIGGRVYVQRYGEWKIILKLNKRDGVLLSVTVNNHFRTIKPEEITNYEPPKAGDTEKVQKAAKIPPLCNYPGEGFLHQTEEEYKKTVPQWSDFPKTKTIKATETQGRHRVRQNRKPGCDFYQTVSVYLTDKKRVEPPAKAEPMQLAPFTPPTEPEREVKAVQKQEPNDFDKMRQTLEAGVKVVSTPQLFPTPPDLVDRMLKESDGRMHHRVLEPSAGTGNILRALCAAHSVVAVEVNSALAEGLRKEFPLYDIRCTDFLQCDGDLGKFDRIIMNPPFSHGSDIEHIKHAITFLAPGGRLVAICANGPRQQEQLQPLADVWIDLEPGTFKEQGTGVNTAMVVINKNELL